MHDSDETVLNELKKITTLLGEIKDIQISQFVQQSRLLDMLTAMALGEGLEGFQELLVNHEKGIIHTAEPRLKKFGAGYEDED